MKNSSYKFQKNYIFNILEEFRYNEFEFSLTKTHNPSPFATIFSIFIRDLLDYKFSEIEKSFLINYLNSLQDKRSGLFFDKNDKYPSEPFYDKKTLQLTTFALSALSILHSSPKYKIKHNIKSKNDIDSYLNRVGVKDGKIGNGNFAMFLGIFLSLDKINLKSDLIDDWFEYHNKYFNPKNGVWTSGLKTNSQWSYQNGLHQFMIYEYWHRDVPNYKKTIDIILNNVDKFGTFALLPGGGACCDYDAVHTLNLLGIQKNYKSDKIKSILKHTYSQILSVQDDISFCENNLAYKMSLPKDINLFLNKNLLSSAFRIREFVGMKKNKFNHYPHWSNFPIKTYSSDLWSIWFRLITIAEIENIIIRNQDWKFHEFPGLGILKNKK
ncbi:hypothetical protein OAR26_02115 [Candidatus Marinimicrobia bacterium]|nr:hypothetical protein [Candidatus Neomarinimicrobiota bacterium]